MIKIVFLSTIGVAAHLIVGVERLQRSTDVNGMRRTAEELGFLRYGSERLQEPREVGTRRWLFRPTFHQYYLFRVLIKYSILIKANILSIKQLYFFLRIFNINLNKYDVNDSL